MGQGSSLVDPKALAAPGGVPFVLVCCGRGILQLLRSILILF